LADGAVVFDAAMNVRDLDTQYSIALPEDPAYATVGGFVLDQLGFIPKGGETFEFGGFRFTVVEMDAKRVARVKIQRSRAPIVDDKPLEPGSAPETARASKSSEVPR
jgi:putative hemolysin